MSNLEPFTKNDGELREITKEDLPRFKYGRPTLPKEVLKKSVNIRLDPDILAHLKEGGKGWQTRLNATLREALGL